MVAVRCNWDRVWCCCCREIVDQVTNQADCVRRLAGGAFVSVLVGTNVLFYQGMVVFEAWKLWLQPLDKWKLKVKEPLTPPAQVRCFQSQAR